MSISNLTRRKQHSVHNATPQQQISAPAPCLSVRGRPDAIGCQPVDRADFAVQA